MASDQQIAANQRNAQSSTGPRTPAGKAAVSQNAFKHGLRSRKVVGPTEDQAEFDALCNGLRSEWQPQTPTEDALVEKMTVSLWKQARYEKMERDFLADLVNTDPKTLALLWRQQASQERFFSKALADLQRLLKFRAGAPVEPIPVAAPEETTAPSATLEPEPAPSDYVMHPAAPTPLRPVAPVSEPVSFGPRTP